jgi:hypothetical protein
MNAMRPAIGKLDYGVRRELPLQGEAPELGLRDVDVLTLRSSVGGSGSGPLA